jgi:hypothetical protein
MGSPNKVAVAQLPEYLPPEGISQRFSIPLSRLAQWRFRREGPRFLRLGYRTILYNVEEFQQYLDQQPQGGERIRNQQQRKKKRAA